MELYSLGDDKKFKLHPRLRNIIIILVIIMFFVIGPFAIIFALVAYFGIKQHIKHKNMLKGFADEMGLEYIESLSKNQSVLNSLESRLFSIGSSRTVSGLMVGEIEKHPLKIFNYFYTVGSGKSSTRYSFTVTEIEIGETRFPHILLRSKKMWRYNSRRIFGANKDVEINLEDKYKGKFSLYHTKNYEIEVLQIFTPQLLDYLIEHGNKFSIEFYGNKIYVFDNKVIRNKEDLKELYSINEIILKNTDGLLHRLKNDFDVLHEVYKS